MKKYLLKALILSALTTNLYADCTAGACSNVTVDKLLVLGSGTILVGTSGDESKLNCTSPGDTYMTLLADDAGRGAMYSALLTAQATDTVVTLRAVEESSNCTVAYVISNK